MKIQLKNIEMLYGSTPFMMGLAYKQFRSQSNIKLLSELNLTLEMFGALKVLAHCGPLSQQEVANILYRERSVTKRLIDNCIKRDLIIAGKAPQNKKIKLLYITDDGQLIQQKAKIIIHDVNKHFFANISNEENNQLLAICQKLVKEDLFIDGSL